jgi:uncharacterized protein YecT (DUF1311 family)
MMRTIVVLAALALPQAALADCAAAVTQNDLTQCTYEEWTAADAALNDAYRIARGFMRDIDAGLPAADRGAEVALRDGQRAWITFRDETCKAQAWAMKGGSAEPMILYGCMAQLTRERTVHLHDMAAMR